MASPSRSNGVSTDLDGVRAAEAAATDRFEQTSTREALR
jgi:hypothetical protein